MKEANNYFKVSVHVHVVQKVDLASLQNTAVTTLLSLITLFLESCCNPLQNSILNHDKRQGVPKFVLFFCSSRSVAIAVIGTNVL